MHSTCCGSGHRTWHQTLTAPALSTRGPSFPTATRNTLSCDVNRGYGPPGAGPWRPSQEGESDAAGVRQNQPVALSCYKRPAGSESLFSAPGGVQLELELPSGREIPSFTLPSTTLCPRRQPPFHSHRQRTRVPIPPRPANAYFLPVLKSGRPDRCEEASHRGFDFHVPSGSSNAVQCRRHAASWAFTERSVTGAQSFAVSRGTDVPFGAESQPGSPRAPDAPASPHRPSRSTGHRDRRPRVCVSLDGPLVSLVFFPEVTDGRPLDENFPLRGLPLGLG